LFQLVLSVPVITVIEKQRHGPSHTVGRRRVKVAPTDLVNSPESLAGIARLVRQFHDLTAGTPLAGDQEVVCHNDLSPKNTVYRDDGGACARSLSSTGTWQRQVPAFTT
jgi:hypothetical protein